MARLGVLTEVVSFMVLVILDLFLCVNGWAGLLWGWRLRWLFKLVRDRQKPATCYHLVLSSDGDILRHGKVIPFNLLLEVGLHWDAGEAHRLL